MIGLPLIGGIVDCDDHRPGLVSRRCLCLCGVGLVLAILGLGLALISFAFSLPAPPPSSPPPFAQQSALTWPRFLQLRHSTSFLLEGFFLSASAAAKASS